MMRFTSLALLFGLGLVACGPKTPPPAPADADPAAGSGETAIDAGTPVAPVWDERRRDETFNGALSLLASGTPEDAKQALEALREVGENEPDLAEVPHNQGVAWLIIGDLEQAKKRFLRATEIRPELAASWQNLGALAEEAGNLQRALQHYRAGLRYSPDNGALRAAEIGVLRQLGQHSQALTQAKAAIQVDSNNVEAYNQLGLVYLETGKVELAQFIYNRAMQIVVAAQNDPYMHANLGRVYWEQGLKPSATSEFQKALEINPSLVLARLYIAEMAIDNRDFETVIDTLEPALQVAPDNPSIYLNLGIGYRGAGRLEEAKKSYEKALELNPTDPSPYLNLAVLVGDHFKDYDQALGMLDTYQRQGGGDTATVDTWRADFEKQKRRLEVEAKRRKRREEAAQRRKDAEAAEKRIQAEKERQAREEAERAAQASPPAPASDETAATPTAEPAPVSPEPTTAEQPTPAPEPPVAAEPQPPATTAAAAGTDCSAVGSCGAGFECANDGVCRASATPGTFAAGIGCFQDADCAFGLVCSSNKCASPDAPQGTPSPWGN
jgi:tetratricopeptide (TPR) repeat protein